MGIRELGELLGVSGSTILKGRHRGHALYSRGFKIGESLNSPLRWFVDDVDAFIAGFCSGELVASAQVSAESLVMQCGLSVDE